MFVEWVPDQSQKFETRCVGNFLEREDQRRQKISAQNKQTSTQLDKHINKRTSKQLGIQINK